METATLSEEDLTAYSRRKDLYPAQIVQWKQAFIPSPVPHNSGRQTQQENKPLRRELAPACREAGLSLRTWRRWQHRPEDRRPQAQRPRPANRLTAEEEQRIREVCHRPEHASLPPGQIVPRLADAGESIASESTFYRGFAGTVRHRRRSAVP